MFVAYINPESEQRLNAEHSEYRWVDFSTAYEMVPFAGQRHVLRHVEREFLIATPSKHLKIELR